MTHYFNPWDGSSELKHIISGEIIDTPKKLLEARAICDRKKLNVSITYTKPFTKTQPPNIQNPIYPILIFVSEKDKNECFNVLKDFLPGKSKKPFLDMEDLKNVLNRKKITFSKVVPCKNIYEFNDFSGDSYKLTDFGLNVWLFARNHLYNQEFYYNEEYFLFQNIEDAAMLEGYITANPPSISIDEPELDYAQRVGRSTGGGYYGVPRKI